MRITDITNKFVDLRSCRGVYMKATYSNGVMTLSHTYGEQEPIAEIYDYKNSQNYRLRLHPYTGRSYNRQSHKNRIDAVLWSMQVEDKTKRWGNRRYYAYIRSAIKIWDSNLETEYNLGSKPLELVFKDGRLALDYKHFESLAYPEEVAPPPVALDENSNLQTIDSKLNAILAGV